jgi:N-acetylglucosaminyl-diphospho-decaprenol L-rhamnosyltransferase
LSANDPSLSVVVVTHNEAAAMPRTIPALLRELEERDELIVADNASTDGCPELVARLAPAARIVQTGANRGFPEAANRGAAAATRDLLVLVNPDCAVAEGWRDALVEPARRGLGFDAWQGLVTMDGGTRVNTSGGVVHFTGIAWAGGIGAPVESAGGEPREVAFASGACLAIPLARWRALGAMPGEYFLYFDDVDLSLRLRLEGGRVGLAPRARADHAYEFGKGARKWRMLERGRLATVIRTYPAPLLALVAPALVATEVATLAVAIGGGWGRQKLLAWRDTLVRLPRLARERRAIQARRTVSAREFARWLTPELDSPYLGRIGRSALVRACLRAYWRVVCALLPG